MRIAALHALSHPAAQAVDPIPPIGTTKSRSRSWKRSLSSFQMVRLRSRRSEPKFETATCALQRSQAACSSRPPPCVRYLSYARG